MVCNMEHSSFKPLYFKRIELFEKDLSESVGCVFLAPFKEEVMPKARAVDILLHSKPNLSCRRTWQGASTCTSTYGAGERQRC